LSIPLRDTTSNTDIADPIHRRLEDPLYLGDTTSNQAILFSPVLATSSSLTPSYPNYTLPWANMTLEAPPGALKVSNFTLAIFPVSSSPTDRIPLTGCALKVANGTGSVLNNTLWQRDAQTWRNEWLVGGLTPLTNYTVFGIINGTQVSAPINFLTKSGEDAVAALSLNNTHILLFQHHFHVLWFTISPSARACRMRLHFQLHPSPLSRTTHPPFLRQSQNLSSNTWTTSPSLSSLLRVVEISTLPFKRAPTARPHTVNGCAPFNYRDVRRLRQRRHLSQRSLCSLRVCLNGTPTFLHLPLDSRSFFHASKLAKLWIEHVRSHLGSSVLWFVIMQLIAMVWGSLTVAQSREVGLQALLRMYLVMSGVMQYKYGKIGNCSLPLLECNRTDFMFQNCSTVPF
jgi:hypothetical protein